jgi:hypothetical protein
MAIRTLGDSGSRVVKHPILVCAGAIALGMLGASSAAAQSAPAYPAAHTLPPNEIVAIVRSTGIEPLSRPVRHGPNYTLHAVDPAGHPVRVVVDARLGRIVAVAPAPHAHFAAPVLPPPYARPPAAVAAVPDGYGPASRTTLLPAPPADPAAALAARERLPVAPGRPALASNPKASATPLPRPRPQLAAAEGGSDSAPPQAPAAKPPMATAAAGKEAAPANAGKDSAPAVAPPAPKVEEHE